MPAKLYYFDLPGKGEAIRLACAHSGFALEDVRLSRAEFIAKKERGELPFGQVPVLELSEGVCLSQSAAIMRYIGE
jgi:glutathione S-transferase